MSTAIASLLDGAVIIALALAAAILLRRRSAAARHAILVTAVAAALAMPALEAALPLIPVIERAAPAYAASSQTALLSDASPSIAVSGAAAAASAGTSWLEIAIVLWAAGAIVILASLATSMIRLARLRARATSVDGVWREQADELASRAGIRRPIALLQSTDPSLLVTCGIVRPAIVLPAGASSWPRDRIRNVLRHELAHVARHDAAIQTAAEVFRALHWFNPLAWTLCRRLRQESEYACDDAVLGAGVKAEDYAGDLLAIARELSARRQWASAHAMAHPSTLERRISAMLHRHHNRAALRRRAWIGAAIAALGISVPIAAAGIADAAPIEVASAMDVLLPPVTAGTDVSPQAQQAPPPPPRPVVRRDPAPLSQATAAVNGTVVDQLGGVIPGANVTLTDLRSGIASTMKTTAEGRFIARGLPASQYELAVRLAGFNTVTEKLTLTAGAVLQRTITLPIGTLQEAIHVSCAAPQARTWRYFPTRHTQEQPAAQTVRSPGLWRINGLRAPEPPARWIFRGNLLPVVFAQERPQAPVRVGGAVRAPRKMKDAKPLCPSDAPAGEFTIQLIGRIDRDGAIEKVALEPSTPQPPVALVEAALTAVRQWVFSPTLLNGVPIDVGIAVRIVFTKQ